MKVELRKQLRAARRRMPAADYSRRSLLAAKSVLRLPGVSAGKRVAVCLPFDRETDTALLLREARRRGRVAVRADGHRRLQARYGCRLL
jgi:5-formyltetrahydrofolate cyclo-ligase